MRHFQRHPHVFQNVVLGLVAAAVAINDEGGGPFLNGRPSASTPVTISGTACTMRVLRRFCASVCLFGTESAK